MKPMPRYSKIKKNPKKLGLLLILVIFAGFFLLNGHSADKSSGGNGKSAGPVPVSVAAAALKDVPVFLNGLGTITAYKTVTVHSQVEGELMEVLFSEGRNVKKGDLLAKIDPRTYEAQLNQAIANKAKDEATLENAKLDLKRYVNLGQSIAAQILDTQRSTVHQLEATVKSDQAAIDSAKTLLSYTNITSPIDGRTGIRQLDQGNIIHPGDASGLVVITQLHPISVIFSLAQKNVQEINRQTAAKGKLVVFVTDSENKNTLDQGVLELVDNQIDQNTGTVKLKATFPNESNLLWPGGFVNAWLMLDVRKDSVTVPITAIQRGPQNNYIYVLKADDTVELRTVKIAMTDKQDAVIEDGLNAGEQVVTEGAAKLKDGAKVILPGQKEKAEDQSTEEKKETKKHRRQRGE